MNGGVTVILCIVGALGLCEAILPQVFAALRRWRQERAKAAPDRTVAASATGVGQRPAVTTPVAETATVRTDAVIAVGDAPTAAVRCPMSSVPGSKNAESAYRANDLRSDYEDLGSVYGAAKQGDARAMVELGDYAYCRGAIVEAFYWTILAELKGMDGLEEVLFEMRTRWLEEGCPPELENDYADFTEEQGEFARAVLLLQCDVDPQYAWGRLQELADAGNEAARLFLSRETEGTEA